MEAIYHKRVDLLLRVLPHVTAESCFALKAGTAINLFVRDMPRLSVDLDLTYQPVEPRDASLHDSGDALNRIAGAAERELPGVRVTRQGGAKLMVSEPGTLVKVEVNAVLCGALLPVQQLDLWEAAQDAFRRFVSTRLVSGGDLFAGNLVAALDRQLHPRTRATRSAASSTMTSTLASS